MTDDERDGLLIRLLTQLNVLTAHLTRRGGLTAEDVDSIRDETAFLIANTPSLTDAAKAEALRALKPPKSQ